MNPRESALPRPKAATGRRRTPGFIRRRTMPVLQEVNGVREPWTFGYLIDVMLTRDPWMHRRAIGLRPASTTVDDLLNTEVPY